MGIITVSEDLKSLSDGNIFCGELPEMNNSQVQFTGKNNILYCEPGVRLVNSKIQFNGDNSVVYLSENRHNYLLAIGIPNNCVFYSGKNNYFNGILNVVLSEQKHVFIGSNCLFSFGNWLRVADPHLVYSVETKKRINPSKSIYIGDHVWIGQAAMILKGSRIFSGSIVGAASVVAGKEIKSNESWAGNPAKKIAEGIFWENPCVHLWTDAETKNHDYQNGENSIFPFREDVFIDFETLEQEFSQKATAQNKLKFLERLSKNSEKERFAKMTEHQSIWRRKK